MDALATKKQVQYLAYKLQEFGMIETEFHFYEDQTTPEAVKICSDKWEEVFDKRIEDLTMDEMDRILGVFLPAPYSANRMARKRLHKKLNKLSGE